MREQQKVEEFLVRNASALKEWLKNHKGQKPPVFYDRERDIVVWVNRKKRREMMKKQKATRMVKPKPKQEVELEK